MNGMFAHGRSSRYLENRNLIRARRAYLTNDVDHKPLFLLFLPDPPFSFYHCATTIVTTVEKAPSLFSHVTRCALKQCCAIRNKRPFRIEKNDVLNAFFFNKKPNKNARDEMLTNALQSTPIQHLLPHPVPPRAKTRNNYTPRFVFYREKRLQFAKKRGFFP
jgi:hypothetical protein